MAPLTEPLALTNFLDAGELRSELADALAGIDCPYDLDRLQPTFRES